MSNIPPEAKCVFKGVIFEVWQWEQQMFDGSTATFERLRRPDTTIVIPVVGDKIILLDQEQPAKPPFVTFPGGQVDKGETPVEGAKRELLEETGYVSDDWNLWYETDPVGKMDWTVYIYVARNCQLKQQPKLEGGEKINMRFITFNEMLGLANDPLFDGDDTTIRFLRALYEPEEREKLMKLLFKK